MSPAEIDQLEVDMDDQLKAGIKRNTLFFGLFMAVFMGFMVGVFFAAISVREQIQNEQQGDLE